MNKPKPAAVVVAIGGSDNSAGAGVQADIKTGAACGAYVCTVVTAITAQNASTVAGVFPLPIEQVQAQWQTILAAFPVACVKIGMLPTAGMVEAVSRWLGELSVPVVVDPVLGITSGYDLAKHNNLVSAYKEHILPRCTLLTPNLSESAKLLSTDIASTYQQMQLQAQALQQLGAANVLVKGGHLASDKAIDVLVTDQSYPFSSPRVATENTHGTGCSLATAIASGLAQGLSVQQSVAMAKTYIQGAIKASDTLNLAKRNGPLHHFYSIW